MIYRTVENQPPPFERDLESQVAFWAERARTLSRADHRVFAEGRRAYYQEQLDAERAKH
jgi:hypothetical protein